MSVQTAEPTTAEQALVMAAAAEYTAQQQQAQAEMVAAVLLLWATVDMKAVIPSWVGGIGERVYVLLSLMQRLLAADAQAYIRRLLQMQGIEHGGPMLEPLRFAGIASDGRDLESLLARAVVLARQAQRQGQGDEEARRQGEMWLRLVTHTQAADAARAAESVAITVADGTDRTGKKVDVGWVRMLTPPSCGRCAVLAGKFYRWNAGFKRHPMCDCRHIPCTVAASSGIVADPQAYFDSLTPADQDKYFGKAVAQAIRDGSDISQVVNATMTPGSMFTADGGRRYTRAGTTKRGLFRQRAGRGVLRPTPWQIYQDAGSRQEAVEMLRRYGYII